MEDKMKSNFRRFVTIVMVLILGAIAYTATYVEAVFGEQSIDEMCITDPATVSETEPVYVSFIDVGQGLSILIENQDVDVLIDSGDYKHADKVIDFLLQRDTDDIDLVIATHRDADHIGAMPEVFEAFDVKSVIDSGVETNTKTNDMYEDAVYNEGIEMVFDQDMTIDLSRGLTLYIYDCLDDDSNQNESSVLSKLVYKNKSFLFTGDLGFDGEEAALAKGYDLAADVLQIGHHGSRYSSSDPFIKAVNPSIGVVSVGENNYGHPSVEALDRILEGSKASEIYSTMTNGTIIFSISGEGINLISGHDSLDEPSGENQNDANVSFLRILDVDLKKEIVSIINEGDTDINLEGYVLLSEKGNQKYVFPAVVLGAGEVISVSSGKSTGDIKWTDAYIWNNNGDPALLLSPEGNVISRYE